MNALLLTALVIGTSFVPIGEGITYTVPAEPGMLFYIQRSTNENTIVYALNADTDGRPRSTRPVDVFWKRYQEDGRRAELDFIQRTFAYGIRAKDLGNAFELRCVAYDKVPLFLYAGADRSPMVLARVNDRTFRLDRIFLQIDGGAFWTPNVTYIEFSGTDPLTGTAVVERIEP